MSALRTITVLPPDGTRLVADVRWAGDAAPAVVVIHGHGSNRANHAEYAERLHASGLSSLTLDVRGHGESGGDVTRPGAVDDVVAAVDWLVASGAGPIGMRGSSMGGFLALHAAARHDRVRAVAALCPARHEGLASRRGLAWARTLPLEEAVARDDGVARGYWHATGDELVPWQWSQVLAGLSPHPRHLRVALGGSHTSLQHDPDIQDQTIRFLTTHLGSGE